MHLKSALKVTRLPLGAAPSVVGQCPSRLYGLFEQCCDVLELPREAKGARLLACEALSGR